MKMLLNNQVKKKFIQEQLDFRCFVRLVCSFGLNFEGIRLYAKQSPIQVCSERWATELAATNCLLYTDTQIHSNQIGLNCLFRPIYTEY